MVAFTIGVDHCLTSLLHTLRQWQDIILLDYIQLISHGNVQFSKVTWLRIPNITRHFQTLYIEVNTAFLDILQRFLSKKMYLPLLCIVPLHYLSDYESLRLPMLCSFAQCLSLYYPSQTVLPFIYTRSVGRLLNVSLCLSIHRWCKSNFEFQSVRYIHICCY